jgi:hypothetical protein
MSGNRRVKYLRKCIVKYTYVGRASCLGEVGLNIYITYIVKYIYAGWASYLGMGGLNIFVGLL